MAKKKKKAKHDQRENPTIILSLHTVLTTELTKPQIKLRPKNKQHRRTWRSNFMFLTF